MKTMMAKFAALSRRGFLQVCAALAFTAVAMPAQATKVERIVSPNGIEAWLVRDEAVPLVAVEFAFQGGTSQDDQRLGVSYMAASLLDEGAGDLSAAAFQEKMEREAIQLQFRSDREHFRGSLRTLKERQDTAFDLLRLALTAPRFDADAIDRIRTQIVSQLRREASDPTTIASDAWWRAAFPNHPYGLPQKGTEESLAQIKADDLKSYVRRVLARDRLKIAIVGDIDAKAAGQMLDRVFGGLPAKGELKPVADAQPAGLERRNVVQFNTPQAVVSFGGVGLPRKHPDFMTAFVVNHVLGGGSFSSRLYQEVREKRGLAYGVSTFLYPMQNTSLFMGWTQVRADRAGDSLSIIEQEIRRMAEQGPSADELAKAKDYLKGSYALRFDTSAKIAQQLVQIQIDDLGIDYIDRRNAEVDAVTLEDVKRVAKSLLSGGMLTTIVGRPVGVTSTGGEPPG